MMDDVNLDQFLANRDECQKFSLLVAALAFRDLKISLSTAIATDTVSPEQELWAMDNLRRVFGVVPNGHVRHWRDAANAELHLSIGPNELMNDQMAIRIGNEIFRRRQPNFEQEATPVQPEVVPEDTDPWSCWMATKDAKKAFYCGGRTTWTNWANEWESQGKLQRHPQSGDHTVRIRLSKFTELGIQFPNTNHS